VFCGRKIAELLQDSIINLLIVIHSEDFMSLYLFFEHCFEGYEAFERVCKQAPSRSKCNLQILKRQYIYNRNSTKKKPKT
jgi:hypothetical protein